MARAANLPRNVAREDHRATSPPPAHFLCAGRSIALGGLATSLWLALVLSAPVELHAQVVGGTVTGMIFDPTGEVIPKLQVSIASVATGITTNVTTDTDGIYNAPNLLPGSYDITLSAPGFETEVQRGFTLTVAGQQVLNMVMKVGTGTHKVQASKTTLAVQLANSTIGAVVDSITVRELPLNGRSWTDLASLQPGVAAIETQHSFATGPERGNRGFGNQVAVAGARPEQNNYRLDGISINDYYNGAPGSVLGGALGVDAVREFSVLTSNYSAAYGKASGGVVNAVTLSGTNRLHGDVYEFLRNNVLDARNFFDREATPPFKRNQFGASAGGPIRKGKLFIFGDYEGIRQSKGITQVDTVPSAAARAGTLCSAPDSEPTCSPMTVAVDPSVKQYLPFWPLPNGGFEPGDNGDIGIFRFAAQQVVSENFFTARVDSRVSERDSFTATYLSDITPYRSPDSLNAVLVSSRTNRQIATLEETHTFGPTLANSARLGFSRDAVVNDLGVAAINSLANDPSLAAIPGQFAAQVTVSELARFTGGVKGNTNALYAWNSFQGYDDASWTLGTHSLKFGSAVERMQSNRFEGVDPSGVFTFATLSDFLTNKPKRFTAESAASLSPRGLRQTLLGLYIQDDWRIRPNLTLNLGVRWEMTTGITEAQGKIVNLNSITDSQPHCGRVVTGCAAGSGFSSYPTRLNFAPRVGLAWDPFHNGKTALRGGFGIFDILSLPYMYLNATNLFPFTDSGGANSLPPGSFYKGAFSLLGPGSQGSNTFELHPHRSYVMQWNLNVQRELAPNLTASVGYVGSRGVHQPFRVDDLDIVLPTKTPQGYLFPAPAGDGTTVNPHFGSIGGTFNEGNSSYNALEVGTQKSMSHGLQLQGSFTWGKSIDTGSGGARGDPFSNSISSLPWYDLKSMRGLSDFNIGRTLAISGTWQIPDRKAITGPAAWVVNGWELGTIYKVNDGVPFTATFGTNGDPLGLNSSDPWDFPNRLNGPGCASLVNPGNSDHYIKTQCFAIPTAPSAAFYNSKCDSSVGEFPQCFNLRGNAGRNILIGPGLANLDFSLVKNIHIKRLSDSFNVQVRAEFFNILNRANFHVPALPDNTDIFDSTGAPVGGAGLLTSTSTTSREIQFGIKVNW